MGHVKVRSWDFDVFMRADLEKGRILEAVFIELLDVFGLFEKLKLDKDVCRRYIQTIEREYKDNPYHNATHATDVLQSVGVILLTDLKVQFSDLEILAMLLAAAVHDVCHPGLNNDYHRKADDELYKKYETSSNERMHSDKAGEILRGDSSKNMLSVLSDEDIGYVKRLVHGIIMKTDMIIHYDLVAEFKARFPMSNGYVLDRTTTADRELLVQMVVHCADISNPCRKWDICTKWSERITNELHAQGDIERDRGYAISLGCDRHKADMSNSQKLFLENFVMPCFSAFGSVFPHFSRMTREISEVNKRNWESKIARAATH